MQLSPTRLNNIRIEYTELLKTVKSFPDNSPAKRVYKEKIHEYLSDVKNRFGQEVIDKICGKPKANKK